MIYKVRHLTSLRYTGMVRLARFNVRLKPAPWHGQRLLDYALTVNPLPWTRQDEYGPFIVNRSRLTVKDPLSELSIESRFRVDVDPPSFALKIAVGHTVAEIRELALSGSDLSASSPAAYLYASPVAQMAPEITAWSRDFFEPDRNMIAAASALMNEIHTGFEYDDSATAADTLPIEAFRNRRGVCQDFAHIMIVAARAHGVPAAYVSGYLRTIPPPGQPRLVGADAMHAWVNLWCGDELGWIGFDPTNNVIAETDHIFVAMGRDFSDVSPLDGVFRGGEGQAMEVSVDVEPEV